MPRNSNGHDPAILALLPDALADVIGEQLAEHRREADRIIEGLRIEARAVVSDLEAKIARLEVANEMLRVEARNRVEEELRQVKELAGQVKDGQPGKDADPEVVAQIVLSRLPPPAKGDPGADGKDADEDAIVEQVLKRLPQPRDGKDADPEQVRGMILEAVAKLPPPEPGAPGKDAVLDWDGINRALADLVEARKDELRGEPGKDGESIDPAYVAGLVEREVAKLPPPEPGRDGKDADPELAKQLVAEAVAALPVPKDGQPGRDGAPGKDGVGVAGLLINRAGECIATLSDGAMHNLGMVVGKDGAPGQPGKDGADGFGFDDLEFAHDGARTLTFRFRKGDRVKEFQAKVPFVFDAGIYREGQSYEKGDGVTFGGSWWVAQAGTAEKPGDTSKAWRLVAKRGRDGKDGNPGQKGDTGAPGRPGRDFTPGGGG